MTKKKDSYIFPAIFDFAEDGISISFPDLPGCLPCAHNTEEAVKNAREAMALHIYSMEMDDEEIPGASDVHEITLEPGQSIFMVEVYMPMYREAIENKSVSKNLTIPQWLNIAAAKENLNFSQILQAALIERLGINKPAH